MLYISFRAIPIRWLSKVAIGKRVLGAGRDVRRAQRRSCLREATVDNCLRKPAIGRLHLNGHANRAMNPARIGVVLYIAGGSLWHQSPAVCSCRWRLLLHRAPRSPITAGADTTRPGLSPSPA